MKRTTTILLLGLMAAISAWAQTTPAAKNEAMPTVDQIIEKYVAASGGKAAIQKFTSRAAKGTFDIPAMGVNAPIEMYAKAPNKTAMILDISGFGLVQEGFDGTVAWSQDPQSGLREKTGIELADTKLGADFYRDIKLKELYPKLTLKGKGKVADKEAYIVEAVPKEGATELWYFDIESGFLVRTDAERETPQGKMAIESYFENYKDVDGFKMPFTIRQVTPAISFTINITEVQQNVAIDDAKFKKPGGQ